MKMCRMSLVFVCWFTIWICSVHAQLPPGTKGTLKLDVEIQDELGLDTVSEVVKLKNIQASEIRPFLSLRLSRWGTVQVNDALNMIIITDYPQKVKDLVQLTKKFDVEGLDEFLRLETVSIPLNYTEPSTIKSLVTAQLSSEGSLYVDNDHNALVITDFKSKVDMIKRLVEEIDSFIPQVVIEVNILEISDNYLSKVGIDWTALGLMGGSIGSNLGGVSSSRLNREDKSQTITETVSGGVSQKTEGPITTRLSDNYSKNATYPGWSVSGYLDMDDFFSFANMLVNENNGKVLAKTRIVTKNNKRGIVSAGERIWYRPIQYGQRSSEQSQSTTGLSLNVTPRIGKENVVTLDVDADLNNLSGWSPDGNPIILSRSVNSTVVLKDGETFVLGGFEKTTAVDTEKGIPILRSMLPFIFSKKVKTEIKSEVIVFLTPHVKRELGYAPEEELKKLKE